MGETDQETAQFDAQDVEKNKVLAIVGYIFPILFFIPLVTEAKNSIYAKFHSNQQLILLIFGFAGGIGLTIITFILAFIPLLGPLMAMLLLPVFWLACLGLAIMGIINAANGSTKKLPVIGGLATLIK
ncbi:MAG: hypothetical protein HZB62_13360 [Nitrospirae bacterium]|nr:hypothetical protein [Nitrospirota bacterium]